MTTTSLNDIVRIDVMEGPNLEELLRPWLTLNSLNEEAPQVEKISVRFSVVAYFTEDGSRMSKKIMGELAHLELLGIEPLGGILKSIKAGDVVIKARALGMTFCGHYNTHKRKGSLTRPRDVLCEE